MDENSFLGNTDIETIERMYRQYMENPDLLERSWKDFFKGFEFARTIYPESDTTENENLDKEFRVINLINAYRKRGHLFTKTNPVRTRRKYTPTLNLKNYGLSADDMSTEFRAGKEIGMGPSTLKDIVAFLEKTYCSSIGSEYMFIRKPERISWLQERIEGSQNETSFNKKEKRKIFNLLNQAVGFEHFIHKKFAGQKRFSLEGTETLIPALHYIIEYGSEKGISEFTVGMAHRGRLNVLGNIMRKPYENIFQEFIAEEYDESVDLGDVKYHLGYGNRYKLENGETIDLNLAPNPSHLEAVSPVIQGIARARIEHVHKRDFTKLSPILIHGDAAIAGQGVVYEVIQMMELNGYITGGTIHIVINNQVGFTTNYLDARSSTYSTDVAKVTKCPIFHVNGDDVEALIHTIKLAMDYRQNFYTDVFIDILSYRKYGHNEGDEPRYTQPTLYKAIAKHPNPLEIYTRQLISEGVYNQDETDKIKTDFDVFLEEKFEISKTLGKVNIQQFLHGDWKDFKYTERSDFDKHFPNEVTVDLLKYIGDKICQLKKDEKFIKKTEKLVADRRKMIADNNLDWAMAELLAYGTLVYEGYPVRISGQDSVRGTFAHRHAAHIIESTDKTFTPLKYISEKQASFNIYNSPLNEYGVLGFEYGYALATPKGLTVWEAQFGDFHNVAQVIIDQYIASAEEKWGLMNGLVLYLPHGFEGQGPEHSSARIERFLSLAARNNMQIVIPTTPANFYHLLRQQMLRNFRVPLIVFTPKSLLRHPECTSTLEELANGRFYPVIDDEDVDIEAVNRIVFCSGKVYYDLLARKKEYNAKDIAIIRLEQLHPFPESNVHAVLRKYKNSLLNLWIQEEPINMGAWRHVSDEFGNYKIYPIARQASGSPATGLNKIHNLQQEELITKVFRECICEKKQKYCTLNCTDGSTRQEILKQYKYFMEKENKQHQK
ncbi:MAG: 2-oxoglutarate dehydrogenase E1 component [Bacteroidales bacterium]|nr:2-oxoglutarate dehydrogenase E1 component [Bacteroidales bacterium]